MYTATTVQENHFRTIPIKREINHHITQVIEEDHQNEEIHKILHKIIIIDQIVKTTIHDRIQTQQNLLLHPVPNQTQGLDTFPTTDHKIHHAIEIETIQTIGIEVTQTIEIKIIQTTDHEIIQIIDKIIRDQMITIRTDQEISHEIGTQVITIDTEIIPSHLIGIITVTPILNIDIEVTHQNIKDKSTKYKQMKK